VVLGDVRGWFTYLFCCYCIVATVTLSVILCIIISKGTAVGPKYGVRVVDIRRGKKASIGLHWGYILGRGSVATVGMRKMIGEREKENDPTLQRKRETGLWRLSLAIREGDIPNTEKVLLCDFALRVFVNLDDLLTVGPYWNEHPSWGFKLTN